MTNIHVILEVEKERQKAEATIHVSRGNIYADSEDENMYAAIDSLTDKLDRQVKKHKEKLKDHHRGEGLKNNERIQDTELYITRIISHRTKPDRKIICRPKKNIMTEEVMKGGTIEAQILHLKYRYPVKTEGIVPEGVIQEGVMKDEIFH